MIVMVVNSERDMKIMIIDENVEYINPFQIWSSGKNLQGGWVSVEFCKAKFICLLTTYYPRKDKWGVIV